jgi:hypothetical protein
MPPKKEIIKEKPPAKTRKYCLRFQGGSGTNSRYGLK